MTVNQISIFLENKYGKLSEILALLAEEKIRIIAATIADTSEYGILRIIVKQQCECQPYRGFGYCYELLCRKFCRNTKAFYKSRLDNRIYVLLLYE